MGESPLLLIPALFNTTDPAYAHIETVEGTRDAADASYVRFQEAGIGCSSDHLAGALTNVMPPGVSPSFILHKFPRVPEAAAAGATVHDAAYA